MTSNTLRPTPEELRAEGRSTKGRKKDKKRSKDEGRVCVSDFFIIIIYLFIIRYYILQLLSSCTTAKTTCI